MQSDRVGEGKSEYPDTPPYSIEGMYFYAINQIESTVK